MFFLIFGTFFIFYFAKFLILYIFKTYEHFR